MLAGRLKKPRVYVRINQNTGRTGAAKGVLSMQKSNTAAGYYRFALILNSAVALLFLLLFAGVAVFVYASGDDGRSFLYAGGLLLLCLLPSVLYFLVQYIHYKKVMLTDVQTVRLERTDTSFGRLVGFEVTVSVGGTRATVVTKHVFGAGMCGVNLLDDYAGKTAEIGRDAQRDEWIVLTADDNG